MADFTNVLQTENQAIANYSIDKVFIFNNQYRNVEVFKGTGVLEIPVGTVMGRINTGGDAGKLLVMKSAATDGSQLPVGVIAKNYSIGGAGDVNVAICIAGEVDASLLVFDGSDDLDTIEDGKTYRDHLTQMGIVPVASDELSATDNQ